MDHTVEQLLAQRLYGLALGSEDLNDHARLRHDPLLAVACQKTDPQGRDRFLPQSRDAALASPATLNRLELSNHKATRCHKLSHDPAQVEAGLLKLGVRCLPTVILPLQFGPATYKLLAAAAGYETAPEKVKA